MGTLYDRSFFDAQAEESLRSARAALPVLFRHLLPASVLDIGCGVGTWLRAAGELGVAERLGADGDYVDRRALAVPEECFLPVDLAQPGLAEAIATRRPGRFDLVMSLEVAEHLPFERSAGFVDELCRLGDLILFSAAIPFQYGTGHINEQWPEFWAMLFRARGYACFDLLRPALWASPQVCWWYAQNLLVFAREGSEAHARLPVAAAVAGDRALALVHPQAWLSSILNLWHPHRAAARKEEPQDLRDMLDAWVGQANGPPVPRAVQRAATAPPDAPDVFPRTRMEIAQPEALLAEAEAEIARGRGELDARQDALEQARRELEAKLDEAVAVQDLLVREQARTATLKAANATLREQVARQEGLGAEVGRLARALAATEAELATTRQELTQARAEAEALRARLTGLLSSTSWRLTAPVRAVRRLIG